MQQPVTHEPIIGFGFADDLVDAGDGQRIGIRHLNQARVRHGFLQRSNHDLRDRQYRPHIQKAYLQRRFHGPGLTHFSARVPSDKIGSLLYPQRLQLLFRIASAGGDIRRKRIRQQRNVIRRQFHLNRSGILLDV